MKAIMYHWTPWHEFNPKASISMQRSVGKKFARKHGIEIVNAFRENEDATWLWERHPLLQAISYCLDPRNEIGLFLVHERDHIAHEHADYLWVKAILLKHGVHLIITSDPLYPPGESNWADVYLEHIHPQEGVAPSDFGYPFPSIDKCPPSSWRPREWPNHLIT